MLIPDGASAKNKRKKGQPIKHLQKLPYRSAGWQAYYSMRPLVEAAHKLLKDATEDLGNPAKRSGRGYAFQYLASTLAAVSSNLRRILTFY
jgi:hypothetical protein